MKRNYSGLWQLIFIFLLFFSCSDDIDYNSSSSTSQEEVLSPSEINNKINSIIESGEQFTWKTQGAHFIWSATTHGNQILSIGYGADNQVEKTNASEFLKNNLLAIIAVSENKKLEEFVIYDDENLNFLDVKISKLATVKLLLEEEVRYIEPSGYRYFEYEQTQNKTSESSGCGFDSEVLNPADYTTITPNAKASWNFYKHNIPSAWNYSTGAGIGIGVIDTGLTPNNLLMNSGFDDGYSSGRYVKKYGTYVDSWWPWSTSTDGADDKCGHGTSMTATATAPRNDIGMPVGVAYNANLISYRATSNVLLDGYHEQKGVANALKALADRSDVQIISMSIGHIFSIGKISDAIHYAYNRQKMIFAAGGTSTSFTNWYGVIFPAWMNETVAVTGLTDANYYKECDVCHKGSEIDFTVIMQRDTDNSRKSVVQSYYDGQTDYSGGSSVATATTAGIAALVWARHPNWTREQVLNKLKQSAAFYPNKNADYGYGNIDAMLAVQ